MATHENDHRGNISTNSDDVDRSEHQNEKLTYPVVHATSDSDDLQKAEPVGKSFNINSDDLPKGYFRSSYFIGSALAVGLSLTSGVGGFALLAPILGYVNADIGPDKNITWVALVYTLMTAVGLVLVGRLTDLFGRRWFFILGGVVALVGNIIAATAKSIPVLIFAQAIIGLAACTQLQYPFVIGELVPMRYRFLGNSYSSAYILPFSGFGPAISYAFIVNTTAGWRWAYYLMIITNAVCLPCWYFFYHPPTFSMKHGSERKWRYIKEFDYVGTLLFVGGLLLLILGLSWGGSVYPWKDAHTIATLVVGGVTLIAFALYETLAPLKEPLIPVHLFKRRGFTVASILLAIGASIYYASAIVWPTMVASLWGDGDLIKIGLASSAPGTGVAIGGVISGLFAESIGKAKYQIIFVLASGAALIAAVASCTPDTLGRGIAFMVLGGTLIGWNENLNFSLTSMCIEDQREIGVAVGVAGTIRGVIGSIATAIYTTVLSNRLSQTIPEQVPPALVAAGLPPSSVASFLTAYAAGTQAAFEAVQGLTPEILAAGTRAYKWASADAYKTVFLVSLAFSGIALILSFFGENVDHLMTGEVTVPLHDTKTEKIILEDKVEAARAGV